MKEWCLPAVGGLIEVAATAPPNRKRENDVLTSLFRLTISSLPFLVQKIYIFLAIIMVLFFFLRYSLLYRPIDGMMSSG